MMKQLFGFVALACLMLAVPVYADSGAKTWSEPDIPDPASYSLEVDEVTNSDTCCLYNLGAKKFLTANEDLVASFSDDPSYVIFVQVVTSYCLGIISDSNRNLCFFNAESKQFYFDTGNDMASFSFTPVGGYDDTYVYTLNGSTFSSETETGYMGYDVSSNDPSVIASLETAEDESAYWMVVSVKYMHALAAMEARPALDVALTKALELGLDSEEVFAEAVEAYNSGESTEDDINGATAAVRAMIMEQAGWVYPETHDLTYYSTDTGMGEDGDFFYNLGAEKFLFASGNEGLASLGDELTTPLINVTMSGKSMFAVAGDFDWLDWDSSSEQFTCSASNQGSTGFSIESVSSETYPDADVYTLKAFTGSNFSFTNEVGYMGYDGSSDVVAALDAIPADNKENAYWMFIDASYKTDVALEALDAALTKAYVLGLNEEEDFTNAVRTYNSDESTDAINEATEAVLALINGYYSDWTDPDAPLPAASEIASQKDNYGYLYNVGSGEFLANGDGVPSLGDEGLNVRIMYLDSTDDYPDGDYPYYYMQLKDEGDLFNYYLSYNVSEEDVTGWFNGFRNGSSQQFVFTKVEAEDESFYTIESNVEGVGYLVYDGENTAIATSETADGVNAYWILVSASALEEFLPELAAYKAAKAAREYLDNALADAQELGIAELQSGETENAYTKGVDVYDDSASTADEIDAATAALAEAVQLAGATIEELVTDWTAYYRTAGPNLVANPSFRYGLAAWANEGLTVEKDEDGAYSLTATEEASLLKAWSVESGKTYYFSYKSRNVEASFGVSADGTAAGEALEATSSETDEDGWTVTEYVFTAEENAYAVISATLTSESSLTDFVLCELAELPDDDEYAVGDQYSYTATEDGTETTTYYEVAGENLVVNGGFNDGLNGWVTGAYNGGDTKSYTETPDPANFPITTTGGYNEGAYVTVLNNGMYNNENALEQAIAVEPGKTYLFICYANGAIPHNDNWDYCGALVGMTDANRNAITNLTTFNYANEDEDNEGYLAGWTKTEFVFTAENPYVGIECTWTAGTSFDAFQLYEIVEADYTPNDVLGAVLGKDESDEAITTVTTPTVNIDSEEDLGAAFKYSSEEWSALSDMVDGLNEAQEADIHYTESEYETLCDELQALVDASEKLNGPEVLDEETGEYARYKMVIENADNGEQAATLNVDEDEDGQESSSIKFDRADTEYLCQAFEFTPVDGVLNGYTISYTDANGETHYLCATVSADDEEAEDDAEGGEEGEESETTVEATLSISGDAETASTFVVVPDEDTDEVWHILYSATGQYLGFDGEDNTLALVTEPEDEDADNYSIEISTALKVEATYNFTYNYATAILPFQYELPEGVEAFECDDYLTEDNGLTFELVYSNEEGYTTMEANTPYILKYTGEGDDLDANGKLTFKGYGAYTGTETTITGGMLVGSLVGVDAVPVGYYVLQHQDEETSYGFAFYQVVRTQPSMAAYHCYLDDQAALSYGNSNDAKTAFLFPGTDVETAISSISDTETADGEAIYDLSGRKISRPQHGVYIKGGKKVVIK